MNDPVDPNRGTLTDKGSVEDRRTRRQENIVLDSATREVGSRPHEDVIPNANWMLRRTAKNSVLHRDALRADLDRSTLGSHYCPEEYPASLADRYVPQIVAVGAT